MDHTQAYHCWVDFGDNYVQLNSHWLCTSCPFSIKQTRVSAIKTFVKNDSNTRDFCPHFNHILLLYHNIVSNSNTYLLIFICFRYHVFKDVCGNGERSKWYNGIIILPENNLWWVVTQPFGIDRLGQQ